jgi:HrpA-like RNA helicase
MSWISQQSAEQRKGRTGRDRPGTCVRFCTEEFFDLLDKVRQAEIHRSPLESVILELLGAFFRPAELLSGLINSTRIEEALILLRRLEMVDHFDFPTDKGRFVSNFPISVRNGAILYDSIHLKSTKFDDSKNIETATQANDPVKTSKSSLAIYPTCVFLAFIECANGSYLWLPRKVVTVAGENGKERKRTQKIDPQEEAEFIEKNFSRFRSEYELVALAKIWNSTMKATGGLFSPRVKFEDYTRRNHLNTRRFLEVRALLRQMSGHFAETGPETFIPNSFDELAELRNRLNLFATAYESELWMNGINGRYRRVADLGRGRTASLSNRQVICPAGHPNYILALSGMTIMGNRGAFQLISLWLPCLTGPETHSRVLQSVLTRNANRGNSDTSDSDDSD